MALKEKTTRAKPGRILIYDNWRSLEGDGEADLLLVVGVVGAPLTARVFFLTSLVNYHLEKEPRCVHMSMECSF